MMYPEFWDHSDIINTTPVRPNPPPYVPPSLTSAPAATLLEDDLEVVEEPPPAYPSPRTSTTIFTTAYPPPIRNRTVRTVNPNVQIPDTYPGFAFCKFTAGKIETVIRLTVVVMLLVSISLSGVAIHEEGQVITDGRLTVDATGWRGVAGWIICATSVAIIAEGLMLLFRFLNPSCVNNNYGGWGGLDISRCILVGIGLFVGCIITGAEAALAADDIDNHCDDNPYNTDNNRACRQLETIYNVVIAVTTVNVLCLVLLMTLATWDIIYIYNGLNSKVPVPRARDQANQQRRTENAIMNRL